MTGAPYKDAYKKYELTPEGIAKRAKSTVDFWKGMVLVWTSADFRCQAYPIANEEGF